jgi:hypothetical protein
MHDSSEAKVYIAQCMSTPKPINDPLYMTVIELLPYMRVVQLENKLLRVYNKAYRQLSIHGSNRAAVLLCPILWLRYMRL